ncbi:MAG: UDP-N-acetylglucosamine 2-epimerase [Planctomycetota bacterium]
MTTLRLAVVTGTRAEFGLLTPVMRAIADHDALELSVIASGAHLVGDEPTLRDVETLFSVDAMVPMQVVGHVGRLHDARACGRGISGFADAFDRLGVGVVVVLGDRIEAFAAASAGSVMGVPVVHLHGGDVAEGVADEAMRHAITKLAHLHLPATRASAGRIMRMGEDAWRVHEVGSPAADVVRACDPMGDEAWDDLGRPEVVVLHHPCGLSDESERGFAGAIDAATSGMRTLWLAPNHDPGRGSVIAVRGASRAHLVEHLPSISFTGMLKRLASSGGVLVGNSSCALIEGAIVGLACVDIGPRQRGRERCANVVHIDTPDPDAVRDAIGHARGLEIDADAHPYGDGRTGERAARLIAETAFSDPRWLRKRNAY